MTETVLESASCPLGCAPDDEEVLRAPDRLNGVPGIFRVVRCSRCGLMRTDPRPTPQYMAHYYPDNYGPYEGTRVRAAAAVRRPRWKQYLGLWLRRFFDLRTHHLPAMRSGRMLEIGCASGAFLHRMAALGWQVEGIEFSPVAAQAAIQAGYHVHEGALETAPEPMSRFDLIVGWMVLEHLHDPVSGLRKLRAWAQPGAALVLSVPNAGSLEFVVFRQRWYALQVPTHLYHFTPTTIRKVLEAAGWELEKVYHQRVLSNLVASLGYWMHDRGHLRIARRLIEFPERAGRWMDILFPVAWLFSVFGQTGRMTIWARVRE